MVTQPGVVWWMGRGQASHALTGVAEVGILLGSVFLNISVGRHGELQLSIICNTVETKYSE